MSVERTRGPASISMFDQAHAEAMGHLRRTSAFVLATLNADGTVRFQAVSRDLSAEGLQSLLEVAGETAIDSASEMGDCS